MKKIFLVVMLPLMINAMENKKQALLNFDGRIIIPDYISSAKLAPFNCPITKTQRELFEKVLVHKYYHLDTHEGSCCQITGYFVFFAWLLYGAEIAVILSLVNGNPLHDTSAAAKVMWNITLLPTAAVFAAWLAARLYESIAKKPRANRLYLQYLKDGKELGLGSSAKAILDLLDDGYKGQILCNDTCETCTHKRKECVQCSEFYTRPNPIDNSAHKICRNCWDATCAGCTLCKEMRNKDRCELLMKQLGSTIDRKEVNFDSLRLYLQAIMKKQSEDARVAV